MKTGVLPGMFTDPSPAAKVAGERKRDRGLAQAKRNADDEFLSAVTQAWDRACRQKAFVTSDDLWLTIDLASLAKQPERPAVIGAVIRASVGTLVQPTDRFVNTARESGHARPIRVWRSLVFMGRP